MEPLSYAQAHTEPADLSSLGQPGWPDGVVVNLDRLHPFKQDPASFAEDFVIVNLGRSARVQYAPGDGHRPYEAKVRTGGTAVFPAGRPTGWDLREPATSLSVQFRPGYLRNFAAAEGVDPGRVELRYEAPLYDPVVHHLGQGLAGLLRSGGCPLTAGWLCGGLAAYLLERRAARPLGDGPPALAGGGRELRRAIDYIEAHLADPGLTAEALAAALGRSVRQVFRLFAGTGHGSMRRYIIRRRVEEAARLLIERRHWTVDRVAVAVGFGGAGHLSRPFRAVYGVTPSEYRSNHR